MKILHNKSTRNIAIVTAVCIIGFLLAYLSGGMLMVTEQPEKSTTPLPEEVIMETPKEEESPSEESETPAVNNTAAANYYVRLTRGLSSSEDKLVLEQPIQLKTSVEYRGKVNEKTILQVEEIDAILSLLQNAERLPDDTKIVSTSGSRDVSLILPYLDGYGNLYVFEGYPNGAKKALTLIQDNSNHLYQCKASVIDKLYDMLKPVETSLNAERISVYNCRDYEKGSLKAQCKDKAEFELLLTMLNSLEKQGSSLDLDDPDYIISLLPENSVTEDNYCYLWLDGKQLKVAFVEDSITVYESTEVTSSQMKKWVKEFRVK